MTARRELLVLYQESYDVYNKKNSSSRTRPKERKHLFKGLARYLTCLRLCLSLLAFVSTTFSQILLIRPARNFIRAFIIIMGSQSKMVSVAYRVFHDIA